jgi:hypothetical protein
MQTRATVAVVGSRAFRRASFDRPYFGLAPFFLRHWRFGSSNSGEKACIFDRLHRQAGNDPLVVDRNKPFREKIFEQFFHFGGALFCGHLVFSPESVTQLFQSGGFLESTPRCRGYIVKTKTQTDVGIQPDKLVTKFRFK